MARPRNPRWTMLAGRLRIGQRISAVDAAAYLRISPDTLRRAYLAEVPRRSIPGGFAVAREGRRVFLVRVHGTTGERMNKALDRLGDLVKARSALAERGR